MGNYTITTDFASKDNLISGNPLKLIKGADFTTEFNNIVTAIASKFDLNSASAVMNIPATNQQFVGAGAKIQRLNDRVMVGDASANDGLFPNITKDWLSAWQTTQAGGPPNGTVLGVQFATLGNQVAGISGGLFAARTLNQGAGGNILVLNSFGINDNPTFATSLWSQYTEAHRWNDIVGQTVAYELDVTQRGSLAQASPYFQNSKEAVGFISACGAGYVTTVTMTTGTPGVVNWAAHGFSTNQVVTFSSTYNGTYNAGTMPSGLTTNTTYFVKTVLTAGTFTVSATAGGVAINFASNSTGTVVGTNQYHATAAYYVAGNPVSWDKGIIFAADSITGTDGVTGSGYALNFAKGHLVQWWATGGVPTGVIQAQGTTSANAVGINLAEGALQIFAQNGLQHTNFQGVAGAVNYLNIFHGATANPVVLQTAGSDTNVDLEFLTQGTGFVRFGSASHFTANGTVATTMTSLGPPGASTTVREWLTIKNAATGAIRYVPCY